MSFLTKQTLHLLRNALVYFVLLVFSLFSLVPQTAAQTQPVSPTQTSQPSQVAPTTTPTTNLPVNTPTPQTVTLPNGTTETGQVANVCDVLGDVPGVGFIFGGGCSLAGEIVSTLWTFMSGKLLELIFKCITFPVHILLAVGGVSTANACEGTTGDTQTKCAEAQKQLSQIDPLMAPEAKIPVNALNILDGSYNSIYANVPQVNPITEVGNIAKNNILGIGSANAQATESQGITTIGDVIKGVWQKIRDLAYIASVIILVIIGFMVMLRRRLDPKTVVTATNSLPRIAVALILITFSFALAGLFVDFIYLSVSIVTRYFGDLGYINRLTPDHNSLTWLPVFAFFAKPVLNWPGFLGIFAAGGLIGGLLTGGLGWLAAGIALLAALGFELIIRIGIFLLAILLFWKLLVRYVTMLVLTVFSPFFFLVGAIPGFESITVNWFKRMAASVLTFPAILVIAYLGAYFLTVGKVFSLTGDGSITAPPPLGGADLFVNIGPLIGLGILYFAAKVPDALDDLFGVRDKSKGPTPLILASTVGSGLQTVGSVSKGIQGGQQLVNTTRGWGNAFKGALGRGGWGLGESNFDPATGTTTTAVVAKKGPFARAAQFFASPDVGAGRTSSGNTRVTSKADRDAAILKEYDTARFQGRAANPKNVNPIFGPVTHADFDDVRDRFVTGVQKTPEPGVEPADSEEIKNVEHPEREKS
ncbi:MAG TPA: hypothetical protein VLE47_04220 [Candidatus Saccharimonadales bacterium]|nr:hypothetical protein [Candidatus Saccharimonadales bacterium]